jgi:ectoine hydroxylase-related dioxygenase (phytanoyl-CoA dioxygenase family)
MPIARYGVREQTQTRSLAELCAEQVRIVGYTVVESVIPPRDLHPLRGSLDAMIGRHEAEAGGREALARIGEADTVRAPLAEDPRFLEAASDGTILAIVRALLGEYVVLIQQNGIVNRSHAESHRQAAYHRDLPYQHLVTSRPLAVSALLCLDAFEPDTGCTHVLPGSHKMDAFPSDGYVERMEQPVSAKPGSYIVMDAMLYHRAGRNRSGGARRAVNNVYALPIVKQQIVLPALLAGRWSDDAVLARLLGYESDPPRSVAEYRARREARAAER